MLKAAYPSVEFAECTEATLPASGSYLRFVPPFNPDNFTENDPFRVTDPFTGNSLIEHLRGTNREYESGALTLRIIAFILIVLCQLRVMVTSSVDGSRYVVATLTSNIM